MRDSGARDEASFRAELDRACERMASARPTAVNLAWAVERVRQAASAASGQGVPAAKETLLAKALELLEDDRRTCRRMAEVGSGLVRDGAKLLTHCNTGALATAGIGTALAVVFESHRQGKRVAVFVDETRPLLQGARLTAWELQQAGIPATLICDNTAAQVMREGRVDAVFVGADRIARNGDTANKIGTYGLAVLARAHAIPFYVVAPVSTFDLATADGSGIPIEERSADEVTSIHGRRVAPEGIAVYSPAFDVTPAKLISGIVTERGLISPVDEGSVLRVAGPR
jgi:methylthioribose-1-phosphate isomerase